MRPPPLFIPGAAGHRAAQFPTAVSACNTHNQCLRTGAQIPAAATAQAVAQGPGNAALHQQLLAHRCCIRLAGCGTAHAIPGAGQVHAVHPTPNAQRRHQVSSKLPLLRALP